MFGASNVGTTSGRVARKRMSSDPDFDDDVLLPYRGTVPYSPAFFPPKELKFFDCTAFAFNPSTNADGTSGIVGWSGVSGVTNCSTPTRGDGPTQFSGRSILIKSWSIRGSVSLDNFTAALTPPDGRLFFIALVVDSQTNQSQCTSQSIIGPSGLDAIGTAETNCTPNINLLNSNRFSILRRDVFGLNAKSLTIYEVVGVPPAYLGTGMSIPFEFFVPLDLRVDFNTFSSPMTVANVVNNSLHVVCFTTYHSLAVGQPTVSCGLQSRIRFFDLPQ